MKKPLAEHSPILEQAQQASARETSALTFQTFPIVNTKKQSNARHQPPRTQPDYGQASRMKATLFAVGCMALLGAALARAACFYTNSIL